MAPSFPVAEHVPLASLTTLGLGGPARYLATPSTQDELVACLEWGNKQQLERWILGGGSNVVIADEGLPGLVIQWVPKERRVVQETEAFVDVLVEGGHNWDELVAWSVENNLAGIECLSGIPGSVGAAPIQNIGAYGQELCETFVKATVLDLETYTTSEWDAQRCDFGYRHSALKPSAGRRFLVLDVTLRFTRNGEPALRYGELQHTLEASDKPISLALVRETVIRLRRRKGMVFDPNDPNSRSAGSFFTNPILSLEEVEGVREKLADILAKGLTMPVYPAGEGQQKLAAAWLIERAGLTKGTRWGNVGISDVHALALVNKGGGTTEELLSAAKQIQKQVLERTGVLLQPEPVFLAKRSVSLDDFAS